VSLSGRLIFVVGGMIYITKVYIQERLMHLAKWGNSLAVRLPAGLVKEHKLKAGDQIDVRFVEGRTLEVEKARDRRDREGLLAKLRKHRGMIPADFKFNRSEIYERD
jgi:antitoxin MazE